ncbi:hypothetical protein T484DRAFT_1836337 [Baffinella frigidus]|nr:hypothetical protein T484DRAFT_1836337 [Cryptophyta sp. CCMP2293]
MTEADMSVEGLFAALQKKIGDLTLCFSDARLDDETQALLFKSLIYLQRVSTLDLSENNLSPLHIPTMGKMLSVTPTLVVLCLRGCRITDSTWEVLCRDGLERNKSLKRLDVSYNLMTDLSLDFIETLILTKGNLATIDISYYPYYNLKPTP